MKDAMTKKKKSKRKHKRHNRERLNLPEEASSPSAKLEVSLETSISAAAGCSWGSAFAAAAQIEPAEGIDEEFLKQTKSSPTQSDAGLVKISQLAAASGAAKSRTGPPAPKEESSDDSKGKESMKRDAHDDTKSYKRKRGDDDGSISDEAETSSSEEPVSLEGRMVSHPHEADQVMVLIDSKNNIVYSALERTSSGDYLRVGTVEDGTGKIVFDKSAFAAQEDDDRLSDIPASFPFPTDADDHCETPMDAYRDILPFLEKLCRNHKKNLAIYDPYYCNGAVKRHFKELGFPNVHNEKVDCYQVWRTGVDYPDFNVLVTNPPYSDNHIPQLLQHVTSRNFGNRPWFLLLPTWVHKKDYYKTATVKIKPFYLVPKKRYIYLPPKQFREKKASDVHKKSSPFVTMWYIWGGTTERNEELIRYYQQEEYDSCDLVRSKSALRDLRRKAKQQMT